MVSFESFGEEVSFKWPPCRKLLDKKTLVSPLPTNRFSPLISDFGGEHRLFSGRLSDCCCVFILCWTVPV